MFFDPNTSFDELKESIGYLLHPDAPFIQDFHGMNLFKRHDRGTETADDRHIFRTGYENQLSDS